MDDSQSFSGRRLQLERGLDSTYDYHQNHDYDSTTKDSHPGSTATTSSSIFKHSKQSDLRGNEATTTRDDDAGKGKGKSNRKNKVGTSAAPAAPSLIRRRNRMITSCLECRRRKLGCDRLHPCTNCAKFKRDCVFVAPALDSKSKKKLAELKDKMGSLEKVLEDDVVGRRVGIGLGRGRDVDWGEGKDAEEYRGHESGVAGPSCGRGNGMAGEGRYEGSAVPGDEAFLEPTEMAFQDAAYEDEADVDDDVLDLGFRFGKLRMTDRIGGLFRPRVNEEIAQALKNLRATSSDEEEDEPANPSPRLRDLLSTDKDSYFSPGPTYIAPRSDLFFGAESLRNHTLYDFLPSRYAADKLMQRYWESVHTIAKVVHRPSFEKRYDSFWEDVSRGHEPPPSLQAVVFAAMLSAVTSLSERLVLSTFGVRQKDLLDKSQLGTEMALGKAHFLKTTKTETLQALVMYLIPMCRSEISRAHSALVGAAIRLAECMGFHRDPSEYGLPPVEAHVRRMIWYQLCFLDVRTSEIQGPRPTIHRKNFSTRFPLNVDDSDLQQSTAASLRDMTRWTDMTFTRIRMEGCEFHRIIYDDNARLDRKAVSVTYVLAKIESFRKACYAKYWPFINCPNQKPVQKACGLVLSALIARLYVSVLHRHLIGVSVRIPDRLRQILLLTAIQQLENSIELETSLELQDWSWYVGAFQQYHPALFLLIEVTMYPTRREAHRIWRCLDYIYEVPSLPPRSGSDADRGIPPKELIEYRHRKGVFILTQVRDRMNKYRNSRKLRIPVRMRDKHIYIGRSAAGIGGDVMASKLEDVQSAERVRNTGFGIEGQASGPPPENAGFPPPTTFSNPSHPYPAYPAQPIQPHLYPDLENQQHQYQPQAQSSMPFNPPWQQQPHPPEPPAWGVSYDSVSAAQPPAYEQGPLHRSSGRGQGIESDAEILEDSDDFGLWFMSNMETPGAGAAPVAPPGPVPPLKDQPMVDINWNEWDKLFPPEINNGDLNMPTQSTEGPPITMETSFNSFLFPRPSYFPRQ